MLSPQRELDSHGCYESVESGKIAIGRNCDLRTFICELDRKNSNQDVGDNAANFLTSTARRSWHAIRNLAELDREPLVAVFQEQIANADL